MKKILGAVTGLALTFGLSSVALAQDVVIHPAVAGVMVQPVSQGTQQMVIIPVVDESHGHFLGRSHYQRYHHHHGFLSHLFGSAEHW
ncbi:MAG: hypothetical protein HQL07_00115 [Nitrospirae bacterium]|nr:hypothetical protein [Magnetococcales bacterium]HAT49659.1 hypothetical protein [Alphaproteobacteria bacterium]